LETLHFRERASCAPTERHDNIADDMKLQPLVVIDTNILVSALRSRLGASFALIQEIRRGAVKMSCSPALFLEYEDVLKRPSQLGIFELTISDVDDILADLATLLVPIDTHYQWRPQLRDPSDEMVLEAAVNASASAIITFNVRDFGPAKSFGLDVLTPQQAFAQFRLRKPDRKGPSTS
jgi:putative PIN family toxin of toxin-antitoxin system